MKKSLLLILAVFLATAHMDARRPIFKFSRPFLDRMTAQSGGVRMDPGENNENDAAVLAYIKQRMASDGVAAEGFSRQVDTVRTQPVLLRLDEGDMHVSGHWIYDIEWPSDEVDPYLILRRWIHKTIRKQLDGTFSRDDEVIPYPKGSAEFRPMMDYYADKYRKWYREGIRTDYEEGLWEGAYTGLYQVQYNPTLIIWVRCLGGQYATFYVADFRPGYRSGPTYLQQTINRYNGKEVWLEDIVSEEKIDVVKKSIRDRYEPFEAEANLDDVFRDHAYNFALTESGIMISFPEGTFSTTAGSESFQAFFPYGEVF